LSNSSKATYDNFRPLSAVLWGILKYSSLVILFEANLLSTASAFEDTIKSRIGAWRYNCGKTPPLNIEHCILSQTISSRDNPNIGVGLIILKHKEMKNPILQVITPEEVYLPKGVTLTIGENEKAQFGLLRCMRQGCRADTIIDDKLLNQFNSGKIGDLVIYMTPFIGLRHIINFDGFAEGYSRLK
jgi:invasion protein IalB